MASTLLASLLFTQAVSATFSYTYDYVIVGGGTAGLALAARLSEDNFASVAVVEAGTYYEISNPLLSSIPAGDVAYVGSNPLDTNLLVDWGFATVPQAGANNRTINYPRGKCLGGSSGRNFMIYQRSDKGALQQWADTIDDQSYNFDNLLPYYKKSVDFTPPGSTRAANATAEYNASAFDSTGGPLQVSYPKYAAPFSSFLTSAFNEIGIETAEDFNSGDLLGAQYLSATIDPTTATRSSSQTSFLEQAKDRTNLKVFELSMAEKILFENKTAIGVEISLGQTLYARKEVILSAGAFQSPQLLMVSGIGPAATLESLDIPVIVDLPGVGQNMTDHIFFGPSYEVQVDTMGALIHEPIKLAEALLDYNLHQEGVLTAPNVDFLAWEKAPRDSISTDAATVLDKLPASWPDIEYLSSPGYVGEFQDLVLGQPLDGKAYATILAALVAPQSRGTVTITSADSSVLPTIDPRWLTDPTDQQVAIAAYKRVRAAFASKAMLPALVTTTESYPGPSVQTDDEILETIKESLMTVYHAATTCRMGTADDPTAVVDSYARVFGVSGLRVVDASSLALLPPGHPQSVIYAFAEKIADDIKNGN